MTVRSAVLADSQHIDGGRHSHIRIQSHHHLVIFLNRPLSPKALTKTYGNYSIMVSSNWLISRSSCRAASMLRARAAWSMMN